MPTELTDADWASCDGILPDQILPGHARQLPGAGARALTWAVLEEAIMCLTGNPPSVGRSRRPTEQLALQAERWVRSTDQTWPFSFENVCAALGLEPSGLRVALLKAARKPRPVQIRRTHRVRTRAPLAAQAPPRRSVAARGAVAQTTAVAAKPGAF